MKPVTKKRGEMIAALINSIDVAQMMQRDFRDKGGDLAAVLRWIHNEAEARRELRDVHGINTFNGSGYLEAMADADTHDKRMEVLFNSYTEATK